jgi:hypothetical protein
MDGAFVRYRAVESFGKNVRNEKSRAARTTMSDAKSSYHRNPPPVKLFASWIPMLTGMIQQTYQAHLSPARYGTIAMPASSTPMAIMKLPSCRESPPM